MTVSQIMKCKKIISCVPYSVKANAIMKTLKTKKTNLVPAIKLKEHPDFTLYVDTNSAKEVLS